MQAGRLRTRVAIQSKTETRDAAGGVTETWTTEATRWAEVVQSGGREFMNAAQVNSDLTHVLRLRHYAGLTTSHRILLEGRALNILAVVNVGERNRELLVTCKEAA